MTSVRSIAVVCVMIVAGCAEKETQPRTSICDNPALIGDQSKITEAMARSASISDDTLPQFNNQGEVVRHLPRRGDPFGHYYDPKGQFLGIPVRNGEGRKYAYVDFVDQKECDKSRTRTEMTPGEAVVGGVLGSLVFLGGAFGGSTFEVN